MSSDRKVVSRVSVVAVLLASLLILSMHLTTREKSPSISSEGSGDRNIPELELSASEINFGRVRPGEAETAILTLTHSGDSHSGKLIIDNLFLDELDSLRYSVSTLGPIELLPSQSVELVIGFEPNEQGKLPGRLILNHTGAAGVEVIDLFGEGFDKDEPLMSAANPESYPFGKSTLEDQGNGKPTSLQFGPDGRLYVAYMDGLIKVFTVERNGPNDYDVVATDTITSVKNILNHNDDGTKKVSLKSRLVTGLVVTGTASTPVIYVQSSDPRIGGGQSGRTTGLDTNSGVLSRLTLTNDSWVKLDLVRGLPRSEENHHGNGMALQGSKLYLAAGGNTNMGAISNNFAMLPEYALSAAILEIDLNQIGDETYDLPTLNDEDRAGKKDKNDPFGGNGGKNQAMLVPNGPVQVYSPGYRNAYDVIVMQNGKMYSWDNGPNSGWGGAPNNCSNKRQEPGNTQHDALHLITGKGYYAGHPNPTRGSTNNKFNNSNPQSPVAESNAIECNYYGPGTHGNGKHNKNKSLVSLPRSTNGLAEYTASNFAGELNGELLAASWDNKIYRVSFKGSGGLDDINVLFSNVGSTPLDVTSQSDQDVFPGTIWVADLQGKDIIIYEPDDYQGTLAECVVADDTGDADQDGFTNQDEIANGTDGCSAADVPADADADQISDLLDPDDDNDNIPDLIDPFALDSTNGASTNLGVDYQWENDSDDPGFIARLGFSGLMTNGVDSYESMYDLNEMTVIGAAGVVTVDSVPAGDPLNALNTQQYGFQFGVNVSALSPLFRAHTRLLAPFSGFVSKHHQSMGLFIGTGDQDNYLKLVIKNDQAQMLIEVDGQLYQQQNVTAEFVGADYVDLYIDVDPSSAVATASFQITTDENTGAEIQVSSFDFPAAWLTDATRLAVGILSTSVGADPFPATWDFITVMPLVAEDLNTAPEVSIDALNIASVGTPVALSASVSDDGLPDQSIVTSWSVLSGPGTVVFDDDSKSSTTATFSSVGSYELQFSASDGDQTTTETVSVVVSADANITEGNIVYRINAGGPLLSDATGSWQADANGGDYVNTGKTWASSAQIDVNGIDDSIPAALFQTERYDTAGNPDLEWKLPVVPGEYTVNLYFSEIYIGAMAAGGRVFDVDVEGQVITALDVYATVGGNKALKKSLTVQADGILNISFSHVTQNPAIKGIEVVRTSDEGDTDTPPENSAPLINAGIDQSAEVGDTINLNGQVSDDGLPDGNLVNVWTMVSGPAGALFSSADNAATSVVLPAAGVYLFRLTSTDGLLQASDEMQVTVTDLPLIPNTAPVVTAGADTSAVIGTGVLLSGGVVDDGLPSETTSINWTMLSGPAPVTFTDETSATTSVMFSESGLYTLRLSASDTLLTGFDDVQVTVTAGQAESTVVYRVNVGGPAISDTGGDWLADNGVSSFANTGWFYSTNSAIDTSLTPDVPAGVFQTERWDKPGDENMQWQFPVVPGDYKVRLYFSEIYKGAWFTGGRTFNIEVEGQSLNGLDVWDKVGANSAWVETFVITSDNMINLNFSHGNNNPALKGIEIISDAGSGAPPEAVINKAPEVDAGADRNLNAGELLTLDGTITDDGLPDNNVEGVWSVSSGPGDVLFTASENSDAYASFPVAGTYVLILTAHDGLLSSADHITVTVESPADAPVISEVVYRINAGGPLVTDANGDWSADVNGSSYVNTGKVWSRGIAVDTSGVADVPMSIFQSERYDKSDDEELSWKLPVTPGNYEVRLYFAEIWKGGMQTGKRVFDVAVEGQVESGLDIYSTAGGNKAVMKSFDVTNTDGVIDIDFTHIAENPSIKGIEVIARP